MRRDLEQQESNRLLYVALTRACEGLVMPDGKNQGGVRTLADSDYAAIKSALATLPDVVETDDGHMYLYTAATRIAESQQAGRTTALPQKPAIAPAPAELNGLTSLPSVMPHLASPCDHHNPALIMRHCLLALVRMGNAATVGSPMAGWRTSCSNYCHQSHQPGAMR